MPPSASVADRDAKAEKDRARARTHERTDGRRAGGRDTQVAHIVHSRPAVQRAQRRRGPPRKGAGGGPRPRRDHCTANTCASEHVSGRRDAGVGSGRVADIAVKSDTRVGSATSARPSVRPFVHSRMQVIRANGGRRRQRRSKKKRRRTTTGDDLEVATGGTPRHSLAPRLTTTSAAAHAPQRGDAIAIVVVAGHRWW